MRVGSGTSDPKVSNLKWIIFTGLIAALLGYYGAVTTITYREIMAALFLLVVASLLLTGERGLLVGLATLVFLIGLGYRTITVTPHLTIHPAEILLWILVVLLILKRGLDERHRSESWIPLWFIVFLIFCVWGWVPDINRNLSWDVRLAECKVFLIPLPFFIVASDVLMKQKNWRYVVLAYYVAGVWVSGMGVLEYYYPPVKDLFAGFIVLGEENLTNEGFVRAGFSFWGSPDAVFVCLLSLPFVIALWGWWSAGWQRFLQALGSLVIITAIYVSGHRDAWLLLLLSFFLWILFRRGVIWAAAIAILAVVLFPILSGSLPESTVKRFESGVMVLQQRPESEDSSGKKRLARVSAAMETITKHPLGAGWAAAGWVHSDFLMVTANLGIPAGLLFVGAYLYGLIRLLRVTKKLPRSDPAYNLGLGLLVSFVVAGGLLSVESMLVLPHLSLPIWSTWVLVEIWLHQTKGKLQRFNGTNSNHYTPAYVQLRNDRPGDPRVHQMG